MHYKKRPVLSLFATLMILSVAFLFQNCAKSSSDAPTVTATDGTLTAKGIREIGVDFLNTTPSSTFTQNMSYAKAGGASFMILGLAWNQIETSTPANCTASGTYVDPGNALATFNSLLPTSGMKMSLSLLPVSTNLNLRPSNLASSPMDDALVICRYKKMLDFVFSKIPNLQLTSMQFGNEIDAYASASTDLNFWSQYWNFFTQVSAYAKTLRPGLQTSVVSTLYGAGLSSNPLAKGGLQQIYNAADLVVVTYYPLNGDFTVKPVSAVATDIATLLSLYPSKPVSFNEIGFPSGASHDASSEETQRQFIAQVFKTWDQFDQKISRISFLRLNDLSPTDAQNLATSYGLGSNTAFVEYLQTLGLRNYGGGDKAAYQQLKTEASARGW